MTCNDTFTCSPHGYGELEPNSDISGIGIVIGFVASGWTTFVLLLLRYIAGSSDLSSHNDPALLDHTLRKTAQRVLTPLFKTFIPSPHWVPTLETLVLAMSDQQLVTGLSIIISGYSQIRCGLSFYHWKLIALLAWFSSATHFAALSFLQECLRRKRWVWYVRAFLMTGLTVMVAVALVPTGFSPGVDWEPWDGKAAIPAWCSFHSIKSDKFLSDSGVPMIFSEIILLGGLLTRLIGMSSMTRRLLGSSPRSAIGRRWRGFLIKRCNKLDRSSTFTQLLLMPLVVFALNFLISMQALQDFLSADICSVLWLLFSLLWGTVRLFRERTVVEENEWGFGQFVPVLLLLLPALLMLEGFSGLDISASAQPMPLRAIDGGSGITLNGVPPPEPLSDTPCSRVRHLCNQDFRAEPWYMDNLFLIIFYFTAVGCFILVSQDIWTFIYITMVPTMFGGIFLVFSVIPLCGIVSGIERRGSRSPFLIKLAVDSRKRYRVSRWIFGLWLSLIAPVFLSHPVAALVMLCSWLLVWIIVSSYAFFGVFFSIYSQVLRRNRPTDYTAVEQPRRIDLFHL